MVVGNTIVGTGIPSATTVTAISGTTITISAALTATISSVRVTSGGSVYGGKVQNIFSTQTVGTGFTTAIQFKSTSQDPPFTLDTAMLEYATKSRR
jgi:triosephosphate isomerase